MASNKIKVIREKEQEEARRQMSLRESVIYAVEREYGSTDLKDDTLFEQICVALIDKGFDLAIEDQKRLEAIKARQNHNAAPSSKSEAVKQGSAVQA